MVITNIFTPKWTQIVLVCTASLAMLISGASLAWSSPVIAKLGGNDTVLGRPLTPTEASWVVSSSPFATVFTIILCGYLNNHIGRKTCLVLGTSPRFVCYVIFIFSTEVWMLILGRTINGLLDGMMFATLAMYATEMSSKEIRGGLAILIQIFSSLGILVVWSLGPFMTYLTLNYLGLVISVVLTVPILFIPDSPFSLYKHGKIEEAKKLLLILRGSEEEAEEQIKEFSTNIQSTTFKEHLKKKSFIKAFALSMFFGVGFQLTGYNALTYYMQTILESTHVTISSNVMSSTIGFVQLVASMCTALTTDRFGRKPILIGGVLATSVGMTGLGLFFYLKELGFEMTAFLNFLPLISVGICVLFYSASVSSLMWPLTGELFDDQVRSLGVAAGMASNFTFAFFVALLFPSLSDAVGPAATYWAFAVVCVIVAMVLQGCVPETKGKTFAEIQAALS